MQTEFEICGNHIPYEKITDYNIVQREYIYRPSFKECAAGFRKKSTKYEFFCMLPYAMILEKDDLNFKEATKNVGASTLGLSIAKDVAVGVLSIAGSKINRKRFRCENIAGRCFTTFLGDIPAVLYTIDGRTIDVYRRDEMYAQLGQNIAPTIQFIPALRIVTKDSERFFFGNNIQLFDVQPAYARLRFEMESYKEAILKLEAEKKAALEAKGNIFTRLLPIKKKQPKLADSTNELNEKEDSLCLTKTENTK